jgi:hypothetical protein
VTRVYNKGQPSWLWSYGSLMVSSTNKTDWNIVESGDKHHNSNPFIEELLSCIIARTIYIEWKYDDVALETLL